MQKLSVRKSISEVIKWEDSDKNMIAHFQGKHGNDWTHADANTRNWFKRGVESLIECAAWMSVHSEIIQMV